MNELILGKDHIVRVVGEPTIYLEFPWLAQIKEPGMKLALRLSSAGCTACVRRSLEPTVVAMAGAFTRLVVDESKKPQNSLQAFSAKLKGILNTKADQIRISYKDEKGAEQDLVLR